MRVLVVGGTGFLGYHAVLELVRRGHQVSVIALPPMPSDHIFPPSVEVFLSNIHNLNHGMLLAMLKGQDAVVYAAGADDRVVPKAPAYLYFHKANVEDCLHFFSIAKEAGVKRGVFLGSYFCHFAKLWPELHLAEHHPYIESRLEQEEALFKLGGNEMAICGLRLPYIFGSMPGRTPIWKPLIKYLNSGWWLFYPRGGTNCVSAVRVGEAIAGAVEKGQAGHSYLVGDENLSWDALLSKFGVILGKPKKVLHLSAFILRLAALGLKSIHRLQGRESGLDPVSYITLQTRNTFFDPILSRKALGYGQGGLDTALKDTVDACLEIPRKEAG
ncbi:epimerase [Dehalococcoides mccartyi]|nr:epimerase [Dehalococcoides mccartyi]